MADPSTPGAVQTTFPFLKAAAEIRDNIYRIVLYVPDGLVYAEKDRKLVPRNDATLETSLMFTCKQIHAEARYIPVEVNDLYFRSVRGEEPEVKTPDGKGKPIRSHVIRSARVLQAYRLALGNMSRWTIPLIDRPLLEEVATLYPEHRGIERLLSMDDATARKTLQGELSVLVDGFSHSSLDLLVERHCLWKLYSRDKIAFLQATAQENTGDVKKDENSNYRNGTETQILEFDLKPWFLPTYGVINELERLLPRATELKSSGHNPEYFSATAMAIKFLEGLEKYSSRRFQKIIIDEDEESQNSQPCHAGGLIPFCQKYESLRVERRVDLMRTVMAPAWRVQSSAADTRARFRNFIFMITYWLFETRYLISAGMPKERYSVVFTSESPAFTKVVRDALLETASLLDGSKAAFRRLNGNGLPRMFYMISNSRENVDQGIVEFVDEVRAASAENTCVRFCTEDGKEKLDAWDVEQVIKEQGDKPWPETLYELGQWAKIDQAASGLKGYRPGE